MIKWQGPGVLYHKGRKFKAGAEIPAGILSPDRLSEFVHSGKVKVSEIKMESTPYNKIKLDHTEIKPIYVEPEKPKRKSKAEIEEEELLKMIEEEEGN